jgi:hypothetical protein
MQVRLRICKDGGALYEGIYDISDAESFGVACTHAWNRLRDQRLAKTTSIGALFDALDERLLDELYGAEITLSKA